MIYSIGRFLFFVYYHLFFRIKVIGKDNIPRSGGVVLCSNHTSYNDPMCLGSSVNRKVHFMAKKEIFKNNFFSYILKALGVIPVDRENPEMAMLKSAGEVLKEGKVLGVFAQGTRMSTIDADSAKSGAALFALRGGACIVPVKITATYRFFSKITVKIGEPITFEKYQGQKIRTQTLNEITENIMSVIASL